MLTFISFLLCISVSLLEKSTPPHPGDSKFLNLIACTQREIPLESGQPKPSYPPSLPFAKDSFEPESTFVWR